jgi:hypothetical protein
MIIMREKKIIQVIGAGDIVKSDDEYNYYIISKPVTNR